MSEQKMRENLFAIAQTYATAKGLSISTVSQKIHGNQAFLEKFLKGEVSPTLRKYFEMINQFRLNWPKGVEWPQTSPIPKLGKKIDGPLSS